MTSGKKTPFQCVLVANRGEIAVRIIRAIKSLGLKSVAVYSDADATAPHVLLADDAVHIGPSPVGESYLRGDKIIEAAKASDAQKQFTPVTAFFPRTLILQTPVRPLGKCIHRP